MFPFKDYGIGAVVYQNDSILEEQIQCDKYTTPNPCSMISKTAQI